MHSVVAWASVAGGHGPHGAVQERRQALRLALAWNRPKQVHLGLADPTIPTFLSTQTLPSS
jgi:hypothetical protein